MIELLSQIGPLSWFIFGIALIGLEVVAPSTYLLWPGVSALVVGVLTWLFPGLVGPWAVSLFVVMAVASSVVWVRYFKNSTESTDQPLLNRRASQYIGRKIVLREDFVDGAGYVSVDDSRWRAESETGVNFHVGTRVEVTGVDGTTFKVREVPAEAS